MNQLGLTIDFSSVQSQKAAQNALYKALKYINEGDGGIVDKQQSKRRAHQFLTLMHNYLQRRDSSGESRFYTLLILKLITERQDRLILSVLSSHSLLKYLTLLGKETDPYLSMQQKGRGGNNKYGNEFIRLVLESLLVWGVKFSSNKKNQQSHFKKAYDQLLQRKVVMPAQLRYYKTKIVSNVGMSEQLSFKQQSKLESSRSPSRREDRVIQKRQNAKIQRQISVMQQDLNKINQFLTLLEGNQYQKNCYDYHKLFTKESLKYETIINQFITSNDEKGIQSALAINQFYTQEDNAYKRFLTDAEDYYSYVNLIKLKADQLNGAMKKTTSAQLDTKKQTKTLIDTRKNNLIPQTNNQNKQIVSEIINKLNQKPKNQITSFTEIKDSLSKQKSLGKFRRSLSGMRKSSVSKFGKSITKSRIATIFMSPPNPYPQDKRYQGELVDKNWEMEDIMKNLTRNQGIRRFITSNFKSKNPLFQNHHIQIGFKSQAIYDQVSEFKVILSIELYIGNRTEDQINKLSLDYKGNDKLLLYATPKNVTSNLQPGYQIKHQLLVIPLDNHLSFITLYLSYNFKGQQYQQKIILPNSIIKLTQNSKLSKKQFVQSWNASTIFRTKEFKLTRYISPDSLSKYIPSLSELSSYDQFVAPDSETDYQLGCQVMLMRDFEGVIRISIRPNLNAVLQIGITNDTQQAHQGFIHLLQTMQMLLTHIDHQI